MNATPTQRLASLLLNQPLADYVDNLRSQGKSWRVVARELYRTTNGEVDVTAETLRGWFTPSNTAA